MKRIGYIYEKIISIDNCKAAIINASKGKHSRKKVRNILENVDCYAKDLSDRLTRLDFTSAYKKLIIHDRLSGKQRELSIPAFYPDQCAHHAIMQVLKPIFTKSSYFWSCANIPKRGIDHASKGVERATVHDIKHAKYCVKMDIRKFYPSIKHDVLKKRLRDKIKDCKALGILDRVIDSHSQGLPIGNYTSPWFAEFLLQPLDRFIKQALGIRYYIRYADDLVLIDNNKRKLRKAMYAVIDFVSKLDLNIKSNYQLFKIQQNGKGRKIDFVGKCFGRGFTTIRKRRSLALMRQSQRIQKLQRDNKTIHYRMASGFISRCACFKHTNSYRLKRKYYESININKLKEIISNESKRRCIA